MEVLTPDLCVIGGAAGAIPVAAAAARLGVRAVLVERDRLSGDRTDTGRMSVQALLAAAKRAQQIRDADAFGIRTQRLAIDFRSVRTHVRAVIAAVAPNESSERLKAFGVRIVTGSARFKDARTIIVEDETEIRARRFVIATGSTVAAPRFPGIEGTPFLTTETAADLVSLPKRLIVVGAGSLALELAQAFCRLGAEVTVLEEAQPLAAADPECAQIVIDALARDGVAIRSGVRIAALAKGRNKVIVTLAGADDAAGETLEGSHLLIATGRRPFLDDLGLDAAGIKVGANGIVVDRGMLTSNKRVYAIGDVVGDQSVHAANVHADIVIRNALLRQPAKVNADAVPSVTFTDPELAHVGLTEMQARERHKRLRILRWPYHENDRAQAEHTTRGHIKIVATEGGTVLGVSIVGAGAGDMIGLWTLAIERRLGLRAIADFIPPYPTLAEIGKRAAMSHFTDRLTTPFVRRIMGLFRRSG